MRLTASNDQSGVRWASLLSLRGFSLAIGWLGIAVGIGCAALHFAGAAGVLAVIATSIVPFGIIGCAVCVLAFAVARSWKLFVPGLLVAIGAASTQAPLYLQDRSEPGVTLTVMQANILFDNSEWGSVVDLVRSNHVDILTVDELTHDAVEVLDEAGLGELLPYRFVRPEDFADGTGIYSRFPLTDEVVHSEFIMNNLSATVTVPEIGKVPVYALHPVPPPSFPTHPQSDWNEEMGMVKELLAKTSGPAIVGADFNATYDHAQFRALLDHFGDAADQAGAGHLLTYPMDKWGVPVVGIDHILVSGGTATDLQTIELPGSDHRGLLATVVLSQKSGPTADRRR